MALLGATSNEANQKSGETFKENGLPDDQQNRERGIEIPMMSFELVQPLSQQMQNQKEVGDNNNRIDYDLNRKSPDCFDCFLFHQNG
jgi:hypothetical protein